MTRMALHQTWDRIQSSYWLTPLVMGLLALLLAQFMIAIDARIPDARLANSPFVYTGSPVEARAALLGLATALLTTTGIVYTLLTVPLSVVVSQFGSRLLRLYLRDRTIQWVLGMFVGTFVYCLAVALTIPPARSADTPQLATTVGLYLTLAAFSSLIVLIHHLSTALQAPNVAAAASKELQGVIHAASTQLKNAPGRDEPAQQVTLSVLLQQEGYAIYSSHLGYIQAIDPDVIMPVAMQRDLVIRLVRKPGAFIKPGELIARVFPSQNADERVAATIRAGYKLGNLRTPAQDVEFALNQLVEVGLRAMSPAINDPFTAMTCLKYIAAGVSAYVEQIQPQLYLYDSARRVRVVVDPVSLAQLLDAGFTMLRRASRENTNVLLATVDALDAIAQKCKDAEQRAQVMRHVQLVQLESEASASIAWDKERLRRRCDELIA